MTTRFAADQQRGEIVAARFRCGWDGVWRRAVPGRNHRIDPLLQRFCAKVCTPRERRDDNVGFIAVRRVNAHANIANKHQRTDISAGQFIGTDNFAAGFHQLINALRNRETVDFC